MTKEERISRATELFKSGYNCSQSVVEMCIRDRIVCTGIINAYNFMDGINGITGGYSWDEMCIRDRHFLYNL